MRRRTVIVGGIGILLLAVAALFGLLSFRVKSTASLGQATPALKHVVINEAVRTLLYLPLYHALEQGYFRNAGLDVEIVTGGNATNSFAAMLSGEAQFSQADPMYVPISREKGSKTKVVAQVVARIAVWGLTMDPNIHEWTAETVRGKKISTHVRPMTAFTYAEKAVRDLGLDPDKDVQIIQSNPGTELVPFLNGEADFAFTLEPSVSVATTQGARVILSFPERFGDQIFTGLMTRQEFIDQHRDTVVALVRAYQRALHDIAQDTEGATTSARKYFPQLSEGVVRSAIMRMRDEKVLPPSVVVTEDSWMRAVKVRVEAGDLQRVIPLLEACDVSIMEAATRQ